MKTYHVYILLCRDGTYYTGITGDIERRLFEHQHGLLRSCYTFKRRPLALIYAADFSDVETAIAWEKHVKGWSHTKKSALAKHDWNSIRALARPKRLARGSDLGLE